MEKGINHSSERNESLKPRGLRNTTKITGAALATILGASIIQSGDGKNLENGQTVSIPGSEVLEEVERKGVGDRISEGIKSMLAKGVDLVIPSAHAWDDIAEDDSWEEKGEKSLEEAQEAEERAQEAQERAQEAQERAQQAQEEAREVESTRIEYVREIKGLVNLLGVDFANTGLEEKRNFLKEKGVQRDLTEEESQRILDYTGDISAYIEANY
ncbi:hypothetical protein [Candidatus Absconditicoccus praedator]|uniref:hypothetical protein n=1 Tax=Candidatus Absconditicoccus praedator TaxID=2735562 RepID=UPI001E46477D|nr:hypothetical protein [Candidatus Absconditicoccus praedator]UFX83129.1 hypothetical protein HLG78_03270 [Candidatus Absconditicoccus praedator]